MAISRGSQLAKAFLICSHLEMSRYDEHRVAETILTAPGWARVGITAPAPHIRDDAAHELARVILASLKCDQEIASPDQPGLAL
mgnify:CR=1 FL=1